MPNEITSTGLTTKTQAELISEFTTAMQGIYGADINLDQDTPDGQMMMIFVQATRDVLDLLEEIYNSFNPDNATGNTLDQRVTYNGIQRQAGTYTVTNITITVTEALTLYGLDQEVEDVYTVEDNEGNQWQLQETQVIGVAGAAAYAFRAAIAGEVLTVPNTITTPVSVVLGVSTINNPTTYTTLGIDEEADYDLKIRRQQSVSLASQGYLPGLVAALENITGVSSVSVYENTTSTTDADGIPSHSIWVIVAGTATDALIADAIYKKRNAGAGMRGDETYDVTQPDGSPFTIQWDEVVADDLFIKFTAASLDGIVLPDYDAIRAYLIANFTPGVFEKVNVNALSTSIQAGDSNTLVTSEGFSLTSGGTYTDTLEPATKQEQFVLDEDNIIILPILGSPSVLSILNSTAQTFTANGGFGTYVWSIETDASGGSIDSGTGEYVSGASDGDDTIRVTDSLGNYTDIVVTVA